MDLPLNTADPTVMHIDLNSCFAMCEQQANPLLRGRPVGVAAYTGPTGCVISPSYEAKRRGVKVGMRVMDARMCCPDIAIVAPDPPKYRAVHMLFSKIFRSYSPDVVPKSIDECVIDFANTPALKRGLPTIAHEIKRRMKDEIGEWITCNIGLSTNRFLAKTAASLHKPDGFDTITHKNLRHVFSKLDLLDLCGINVRYEARLNANGIFTPLEFLDADRLKLKRQVFQSIVGGYWYMRLRGWEIDAMEWGRKSYGQSYALHEYTNDKSELGRLMMKLCEKMGRRLRKNGYVAQGIHVSCLYSDGTYWHTGRKVGTRLFTTNELFTRAQYLMNKQPERKDVTHLAVSCFELVRQENSQIGLFEDTQRKWGVTRAMDKVNDRYGEYVITPALMMGMKDKIIDRVPFGGTKDIEDLYTSLSSN